MPSIPNAVLVWQQARPPRCPGSSQLSWVFKMRAMNQLMNFLVFPVSGLQTPGILQDMATMQVQSKRDMSHKEWQTAPLAAPTVCLENRERDPVLWVFDHAAKLYSVLDLGDAWTLKLQALELKPAMYNRGIQNKCFWQGQPKELQAEPCKPGQKCFPPDCHIFSFTLVPNVALQRVQLTSKAMQIQEHASALW